MEEGSILHSILLGIVVRSCQSMPELVPLKQTFHTFVCIFDHPRKQAIVFSVKLCVVPYVIIRQPIDPAMVSKYSRKSINIFFIQVQIGCSQGKYHGEGMCHCLVVTFYGHISSILVLAF